MTITLTAFASSPDRGRGQARDMRVRWALEELGLPYEVRLVSFAQMRAPAHVALHPFAQIPTFEEDGLALFESAGIVLHLATRHPGLLPDDPGARARCITWIFAATNTVEPPILHRETAILTESHRPWHADRLPQLDAEVDKRLAQLSARLGDAEWLEGTFSAGDLVMIGVLRRLNTGRLLAAYPALSAYVARGEARPAFQRAFADQLAVFHQSQAKG